MVILELIHANEIPLRDGRNASIRSKQIGGGWFAVRPSFVLLTLNNFMMIAWSCHSWSTCPVMSLLKLSQTDLQVPAAYCFRPVVSLLELLPVMSHLELLGSHVTPGAHAQSRHSWSSCRQIYNFQRRTAFAQ